jgi:hypothetical protein
MNLAPSGYLGVARSRGPWYGHWQILAAPQQCHQPPVTRSPRWSTRPDSESEVTVTPQAAGTAGAHAGDVMRHRRRRRDIYGAELDFDDDDE